MSDNNNSNNNIELTDDQIKQLFESIQRDIPESLLEIVQSQVQQEINGLWDEEDDYQPPHRW